MHSSGLISSEVFTFNLPKNEFFFGTDDDLEKILSHYKAEPLEADPSTKERDETNGADDGSKTFDEIAGNYLVLPLVGSESYSLELKSLKANGQLIERSSEKIAYLDSGNTLIALPKSFFDQMDSILDLSSFCTLKEESNSYFESLNCSPLILERNLNIQFTFFSSISEHSYSLDEPDDQIKDQAGGIH